MNKSRIPITAVLSIILINGCVSTTNLSPTDNVRNSKIVDKAVTFRFLERQKPSFADPNLEIMIMRRVQREETFQRRFEAERTLNSGSRFLLLLGGAGLAAAGYINYYEQGYVVLGRDIMGLGLLGPWITGAIANKTIKEWRPERKPLSPGSKPAANIPVLTSVGRESWTLQTDNQGLLGINISTFVDLIEPGIPLSILLALQEDLSQYRTFTIPAAVLDSLRPSPLVTATINTDTDSILTEEPTGMLTIAILDFKGIGVSAQEAMVLTNRLETKIVALGTYQVIERGQMDQILQEQDFQLTGCTTQECAVEIGQLIGAQQMLAGSFGKLGTVYTIDMKIIDVETGRILKSTSYDSEGSINRLLSEGLAEAVKRITEVE